MERAILSHAAAVGLHHPVDDRLRGRLELARELLRHTSRLHQFDHVGTEFRGARGTGHDACPSRRLLTKKVSVLAGQLQSLINTTESRSARTVPLASLTTASA